ncbi:zinc transport system substrate-binding protein [Roseivivax halotolerans]|uniref:Zinc transport system substrate-binding protein n=1 Tax=Roseivivax halotolerans TaxID=93684 RepID=A0A1I6AFX6_9RHOB|nr:metallochaperone AztD [Roseivivax halotolerans]SFQ67565.1 zinc transport system substrate-binding protein [Roseivivax halotolerans]
MTKPRLAALAASAALISAAASAQEDSATLWRLFVADHESGQITALDLDAPENRWSFDVGGASRLYATASGQAVLAVQSDDDRVAFLESGIALEGHGDHRDIEISQPARIDGELTGPRPFHVVTHHGTSAINFDRGGYALFLSEDDILAGEFDGERFEQARAHHGFSVPHQGVVVSSVASEEETEGDALPGRVGLQLFDPDGSPASEMQTCTGLHGEAFSGSVMLAGCEEGTAMVHEDGGELALGLLPYPDDFPENKTGTLLGGSAVQIFVGDYGDNDLVVIDPATEPYFSRVEFPFRHVDFVLDPAKPQYAYVLTEDGTLHRLNILSRERTSQSSVTAPYSMDGHWRDPRPRLAVAGDEIVLTDPKESLVRVIDSESLEELRSIEVDGTPYNVLAIGGSGLVH